MNYLFVITYITYILLLIQSSIGFYKLKKHASMALTSIILVCLVYASILILGNLVNGSYIGMKFVFFNILCIIYTSSVTIHNIQEVNAYKVVSICILSIALIFLAVILVYKIYKPSQQSSVAVLSSSSQTPGNKRNYYFFNNENCINYEKVFQCLNASNITNVNSFSELMKLPSWYQPKKVAIACMTPLRNKQRKNLYDPLEYMPNNDVSETTHNIGWRMLLDRKVSDKFTLICLIPNEPYEMTEQIGLPQKGTDAWMKGIKRFVQDHPDRGDVVFITPDMTLDNICNILKKV